MKSDSRLPRVLVIDDQFGRKAREPNEDRVNFCRSYRLVDVTPEDRDAAGPQFRDPIAEAVFCRGQNPVAATPGDVVVNDLDGILETVGGGWESSSEYVCEWALVLLDLCFYTGRVTAESEALRGPGMPEGKPSDEQPSTCFGLEVLAELTERYPEIPVAVLSSVPQWQVSEEYIQLGAVGFLPKGEVRGPELLLDYLFHHALVPDFDARILGRSRPLLHALRAARRSALHDRPVLIRGDRGTGKELLANYIHQYRSRASKAPFVKINSGQLSDANMAFSALFGHRKGAYTGAESSRLGAVQNASGGILFLDEIGNLPLQVQGGLHRLLQEGEFSPLGAEESPIRNVKIKLLAATNCDLEGLTLKDPPQFFPDLLDRLKLGDVVLLPPLRDRLEDLPELVGGFVAQAEDEVTGAYHGRAVDRSVYELLASYDWPGNIRELGACIKSAVNTYKHMERLVPRCIELPGAPTSSARHHLRTPHAQTKEPGSPSESGAANHPAFSPLRPQELAGRLSEIQSRHAEEMAAYVDAILQATSRPSLDCLEGEILLHPAAKLMTGDRSLSASEGADLFKRLLRPLERIGEGKYLTPRLHLALLRAIQIRPSRQKDEQN